MPDCEACKEKQRQAEPVPFIAHESAMARMERIIKRLWILLMIMLVLLVGSNVAWIIYESQFVEEEWSYEANTDSGGTAIANGSGDVRYYGISEGYSPEEDS